MTDASNNSSLPILLAICGAVLVSVAAGWFLLDQGPATPTAAPEPVAVVEPEPDPVETVPAQQDEAPPADIDAELRKARLAADADILAFPARQSAIYFYGRILQTDPQHALARAEFDAVLSRLEKTASGQLAAEEYEDAYELAVAVAKYEPGHSLVTEVQQAISDLSESFVSQAMDLARSGDAAAAAIALSQAESLPGQNDSYLASVRESLVEIQDSITAAEQKQQADTRAAETAATNEWVDSVRAAIVTGQFDSPPGSNAIELLATPSASDEVQRQLTEELIEAMALATSASIESGQLYRAEALLNTVGPVADESEQITELRASLDDAFIEIESTRIATMDEFVQLNTVPARYPRRAVDRGITGWVEVVFTVTPAGDTSEVMIARADPVEVFDDSAIQAVEQWQFEPHVFRGQAINQRATARLVYRLQ